MTIIAKGAVMSNTTDTFRLEAPYSPSAALVLGPTAP